MGPRAYRSAMDWRLGRWYEAGELRLDTAARCIGVRNGDIEREVGRRLFRTDGDGAREGDERARVGCEHAVRAVGAARHVMPRAESFAVRRRVDGRSRFDTDHAHAAEWHCEKQRAEHQTPHQVALRQRHLTPRLITCQEGCLDNGSERGPVALPVFKTGRSPLSGEAGFDSQALPPPTRHHCGTSSSEPPDTSIMARAPWCSR